MIVRSGANLPELFETIHTSRFLGECQSEDLEMFKRMNPGGKILHQSPHDRESQDSSSGESQGLKKQQEPFGFWLPHGLCARC